MTPVDAAARAQELDRDAEEVWVDLGRLSYTGGRPDLREGDVEEIASLIFNLAKEHRAVVAELDRVTRERDEARLERDAAGFFAKHQTEDEYFLALRSAEAELAAVRERCQQLYDALKPFVPAGPRYLSIGSIDNTVAVRVSAEAFERARAVLAEGRTA